MADKRISQLIDRGVVVNNDVIPIVVSGATTTNKATISSIQTFMQSNLDVGVTSVGITLGSSGTDVNVTGSPVTSSGNITINFPTASATNRGLLSAANWSTFNSKVSSVGLSMPSAFSVANSPITGSGTIAVTGAGTVSQYIRGDGSLADFPAAGGGGSSVSYYLNGSISQGTIGGIAYQEMNKVPVLGAGTDFVAIADGYLASFITDAGDPALLNIPAGNWNFETYFSASSAGGTPTFYIELYKVDSGGTATLIASNSATPELIAFGTTITPYFSALAVPSTVLTLTDRLALRYFVSRSGRTITLHTENSHLCQIITTFTTGLTALNGLTAQVQNFATGTSGTDFAISSSVSTHTFNLPDASASARGVVTTGTQTIAGAKTLTSPLNGTTSIFSSAFASNQTSKIGIGFDSGYGRINAWGADTSTYGGLSFEISKSNGDTYQAFRIDPSGYVFFGAGGDYGLAEAAHLIVRGSTALSQALTPVRAKFVNSANNFVKIALGQGETNPGFNDYYGIIALDNNVNLADNKLRFYLGYDDAVTPSHSNDQLVIQGDGNVGIGTATPSAKLHVMGTATLTGALNGTSASFSGLLTAIPTATTLVRAATFGNTSTNALSAASIGFNLGGGDFGAIEVGYNSNSPYMDFKVGASLTQSLRIASTGAATFSSSVTANGLATSANYKLGTTGAAFISGSNNKGVFITDSVSYASIVGINSGISAYNPIELRASGTDYQLYLATNGNVGIGTASPNRQLTVSAPQAVMSFNATSYRNTTIGSDSIGSFIVYDDTAAAYRMVINSAGNVGIGTASLVSPGGSRRLLQISNSTNGAQIALGSSTTESNNPRIFSDQYDLSFAGGVTTGNLIYYTNDTERMRITSGGEVLVGTQTTDVNTVGSQIRPSGIGIFIRSGASCLQLNRLSSDGIIASFRTSDVERGSISIAGSTTSYNTTSDYRLKEDFQEIKGLEKVGAIKVYDYKWKLDEKRMDGVLAHELAEVLPYAVFGEKDEVDEEGNDVMQSVDYSKIVPIMIKAIQELKTEIDSLKNQMQ